MSRSQRCHAPADHNYYYYKYGTEFLGRSGFRNHTYFFIWPERKCQILFCSIRVSPVVICVDIIIIIAIIVNAAVGCILTTTAVIVSFYMINIIFYTLPMSYTFVYCELFFSKELVVANNVKELYGNQVWLLNIAIPDIRLQKQKQRYTYI